MGDNLRLKLGIKSGNKVCLFHARKDLMPLFMEGDLNLMIDWAEDECDAILYWLQPRDDVQDIMTHLERQIKKSGRIWLLLPKKELAAERDIKQSWEEIQRTVLASTSLVDNKTLSLGDGEYGMQFVVRKEAWEKASER
jgi:hypothetical protein